MLRFFKCHCIGIFSTKTVVDSGGIFLKAYDHLQLCMNLFLIIIRSDGHIPSYILACMRHISLCNKFKYLGGI